jgi:hypothetical protein
MTFIAASRVKETSVSTGTGNMTLDGAVSGFLALQNVMSDGDRFYYAVVHQSAAEWEVGVGQLDNSTTLIRNVVASSNSGSAVNFSAGTKDVFICDVPHQAMLSGTALFGTGVDGDVTISSGTTTLTRDMHYRNLTISGTGELVTAGYRVFVSEVLDLTAAPASAINWDGNDGANSAGTTQGGGATGLTTTQLGGSNTAGQGGSGSTGNGAQGVAGGSSAPGNGGTAGASGAGGAGGASSGGSSRPAVTITSDFPVRHFTDQLFKWGGFNSVILVFGGASAGGGGSGGGDGGSSGGGGGGGSGACTVWLSARIVNRGGSTAAGAISAKGGNGGNGGNAPGGNRGGGGGGGGAGGGWVYFGYGTLIGSTATGAIRADGGTGGNGGDGAGTGVGGTGGNGGGSGRVFLFRLGDGTMAESGPGSGGSAGSAGSGTAGGAGGAGETNQVDL